MTENPEIFDLDEALEQEIQRMTTDDLITRTRLLDNECKIMRSETVRIKAGFKNNE